MKSSQVHINISNEKNITNTDNMNRLLQKLNRTNTVLLSKYTSQFCIYQG